MYVLCCARTTQLRCLGWSVEGEQRRRLLVARGRGYRTCGVQPTEHHSETNASSGLLHGSRETLEP